ncbi:MAG: UbiA family prenyltransferase [Steroidobacteraceae bacterium]|nr:UbiA family prenyltransferase [Steroidobacteraceae bacterium]
MKWMTALELGRVSNLPTVWTNTLAGVVLAGGTLGDARLPLLLVALSLFYVGGMFLNDAFDREFDARHRRDRPIPSGRVTAAMVFKSGFGLLAAGLALLAWLGFGVAGGTGWPPVAAGVALAVCIVFYDRYHKQNPLSPVVMGLCRMLVYGVAATAIAGVPSGTVLAMGLLLLAYLVGLTYAAKQEHLDRLGNLWPLACLVLPLLWGAWAALAGAAVALPWLLLCGWVAYALSFLRRRRAGDIPRAVGYLLAGICLWDALVIAAAGQPVVALLAVAGFALTLALQRYIAPT